MLFGDSYGRTFPGLFLLPAQVPEEIAQQGRALFPSDAAGEPGLMVEAGVCCQVVK
jgi:hypothetical protein